MCLNLKVDRETKITPLSAIREALRDPEITVTETSPINELHKWEVKWKPSGLLGLIHEEPINFFVFLEEGHIAQIRAGFDPEPLSPARQIMIANKWNREKRFTKAFMNDNEDSMVLETNVDFEWLGQSPASSFKSILKVFKESVLAFIALAIQEEK